MLTGCATREARGPSSSEDFVGTYEAEHVIDTQERIWLHPDGRFQFEFAHFPGEVLGYSGHWILRQGAVVLVAKDKDGKEVEFPLQVASQKDRLALIYSQESYQTAPSTMLLPNSYRRTSKTPNQPPEPMSGLAPGHGSS